MLEKKLASVATLVGLKVVFSCWKKGEEKKTHWNLKYTSKNKFNVGDKYSFWDLHFYHTKEALLAHTVYKGIFCSMKSPLKLDLTS